MAAIGWSNPTQANAGAPPISLRCRPMQAMRVDGMEVNPLAPWGELIPSYSCHLQNEWMIAMKALDISAVKAFVTTADLQSFTRAADVLETTQSAISLKLRRLEGQMGHRLLERTPRQVRLSAEGLAFLEFARELISAHDRATTAFSAEKRRLAIGIGHLFVGNQLPSLLGRMTDRDPGLQIEMVVDNSQDLMQAFDMGELDAVLILRQEGRRKQETLAFVETFSWFAAAGWKPYANRPLPLATQGEGCRIRTAAVRALDQAGIAWTEVFIGKGAATVGAAASAGLGVAVLAKSAAPAGTVDVGHALSLPTMPAQDVMLYCSLNDRRTREALRMLIQAFQ